MSWIQNTAVQKEDYMYESCSSNTSNLLTFPSFYLLQVGWSWRRIINPGRDGSISMLLRDCVTVCVGLCVSMCASAKVRLCLLAHLQSCLDHFADWNIILTLLRNDFFRTFLFPCGLFFFPAKELHNIELCTYVH